MATELPDILNVLVLAQASEEALAKIKAVAPSRLNVIPAYAEFLDETIEDNAVMMRRRGGPPPQPRWTPAEREATLAAAHVVYLSFPFPHRLPERAASALLFHAPFAGVSNFKGTPYWGSKVPVSTSRGYTQALPIAELAVGAAMMFAKGLHVAAVNSQAGNFDRAAAPLMRLLTGKTLGVIGLGGIGTNVARLAKGLGMRVVATRHSAKALAVNTDGADVLYPAAQLNDMLAECDFIVVAAMWTDETEGMVGADAFAAMRDGAVLINVARGEIVDEAALVAALHAGKLAGAYLDVFKDDFTQPPSLDLASAPNIVITPHVSGRSDVSHAFSTDVLCDNLNKLLAGEPLENVVDWQRGY